MSSPITPDRKWNERPTLLESTECTEELCATAEQLRAIVEHAPEAIMVLDCEGGRFVLCNENATTLFGRTRGELLQTDVLALSLEFQADGQPSAKLVRERIAQALAGQTPTFEWLFRHASGYTIPCEVRLVKLPGDCQQLIRGSIIDMRDRKRREKTQDATYKISEAVHEAEDLDRLYERIHSIVRTLMPADNFYIALYDPLSGHHYYAYHLDEKDPRPAPRLMNEGLNGYVLRTRKSLLANKASMTSLDSPWRLKSGTPSAIWLGVPLEVRGTTLGLMAVQDYEDEHAYAEEEKQILEYVAKQIALAIDRKRAEQALRESEEKFRALFEASSQGVMLHDESQFLEVNPATVRILGFNSADEIIGHHPVDFSAPQQPGGAAADVLAKRYMDECLTRGSARFDWLCRNPRGKEIPIEVILTRIQWSGRQIIQAVINDISERKRTEETLRQRHREVTTLLESLPGYAFFKDAHGRYVMANQNFARAVNHTSESILGKTDEELFPAELAKKYRGDDARLLKTGELLVVGEEVMIEGERMFTVQTTKVPVKNDQGEVVGLIGLGFDITERKNAEAELLKALAREKELGQLKSNFVSMVSHEFRTPLGVIMSSAEILRDYFDKLTGDERNEHLQSIQKNTRRMADLMEEVLLLSRFEAGKMDFQPRPINLRTFCQRLVDEVLSAADCRNPIEIECPPHAAEAQADERLLRHIFLNVLTNALKYSECGQPIRFSMEPDGRDVVCRITDRGIGIPEQDRGWLFNAFHRGRNVGLRPGTGLGLVIVKRCVDLHGGSVHIDSKVGEGTTVTIRLPLFTKAARV